jgi:hypothetical protein
LALGKGWDLLGEASISADDREHFKTSVKLIILDQQQSIEKNFQ